MFKNFITTISSSKYDLIFVVETWLNDFIMDSEVCPNNYSIIRKDRKSKRGGGVLLLYKSHLQIIDNTVKDSEIEHLCVDLFCKDKGTPKKTRFICCYHPPSESLCSDKTNTLCQLLTQCLETFPCFLIGDFNFPGINWKNNLSTTKSERNFLDFCLSEALEQHVLKPTHCAGGYLDLVFTNPVAQNLLHSLDVTEPFTSSCDHDKISFSIDPQTNCQPQQIKLPQLLYQNGNYDKIRESLKTYDWNKFCNFYDNSSTKTVQHLYDDLLKILHCQITNYVPKIRLNRKIKLPKHIRKLSKEKAELYRQGKSNKIIKKQYKVISKKYELEVKRWFEQTESKICDNRNISSFYKYSKKKLNLKSSEIPPLKRDDGSMALDDTSKANYLNEAFKSVFIADDGNKLHLKKKTKNVLDGFKITANEVLHELKSMPAKSSRTPDDLPSIVLKNVASSIIQPLCKLFNWSLETGQLPWQWKISIICPIFKKGSKSSPLNYRPIALTSSICRLFEKIVKTKILHHLLENDLLSPEQHGFLPKRSTTTQMLNCLQDWFKNFDDGVDTNVVYTDFAKAFDKVSHPKLIEVLSSYGIEGKILSWITSFLTNRQQTVYVNDSCSGKVKITSGVPQGSVLGPLLFLIYIDDISKISVDGCKSYLFADDFKVYSKDLSALQKSLDNLLPFTSKRQLSLAPSKCSHLLLSNKKNTHETLNLGNKALSQTSEIRDLGILISSNLKWDLHISKIKGKALQRCFHIFRSFSSKNVWTLLRTCKTFARPLLESNSVIWNPYLQKRHRRC